VTLSQHEQRVLEQIEMSCCAEDPEFAAALNLDAARRRRQSRSLLARYLILIGGLAMLVGTGISRGLLSAGVIIGCYGFVTVVAAIVLALRNRLPKRRDGDPDRRRETG